MAKKDALVTQLKNFDGTTSFDLSADFFTPPTIVPYLDNCSYQINIATTDSEGAFSVQVSNDYRANSTSPGDVVSSGNWSDLTLSGTPVAQAGDDTISISLNQLPYYAVRLHYVSSVAGTGTCSIFLTDKAIGG